LDNQSDRIKSYCQSQGWELEEVFSDPGYSGKDLNRPDLSRMIEKIKAGGIGVVLVYKVDRLTRKQKDLWTIIENIFEPHKVGFKSITEPFETTTPMGRAFLGMLSVFAQLERDQTRERIKDALAFKKVKREWVGHPPYGYRMLSKSDGNGEIVKDKHLTVDEDQARIVKMIFQARSRGRGLTGIVEMLKRKGINGRKWSAAGIKEIASNAVYLGNGNHQPIISKRLFNQAQR
jgi:site-specific DNA recombinase